MTGYPPPNPYGSAPTASSKTTLWGILSIVFAFLCAILGIVFGILGRNEAKKYGESATLPTVGLALSVVFIVLGVIVQVAVRS